MKRLPFDFSQAYQKVTSSPYQTNPYIIDLLTASLNKTDFGCVSGCNKCCNISVPMSYDEFNEIMYFLLANKGSEYTYQIFAKNMGFLNESNQPLCPFLEPKNNRNCCSIYNIRPWICRVYGTTALTCNLITNPISLSLQTHENVSRELISYGLSTCQGILALA